jgi:hypothetical protein
MWRGLSGVESIYAAGPLVGIVRNDHNRAPAARDEAVLQRNTRRMAAAANLAECLSVPGATGVMPTGSITHEAWNDSCIN